MNIMELGAIGEFVGSIAVLATLVYLAVQLRQSKELLERNEKISLSQVNQARTDSRIGIMSSNASEEFAALFCSITREGEQDFDPGLIRNLSDKDRLKLRNVLGCTIAHFENVLYQNQLGLVSKETIPADLLRRVVPGWQQFELDLSPQLLSYYEEIRDV